MKDPDKGIGCTIKSAAGHIFVNRIIEDGPIARTGVLRPGTYTCMFAVMHACSVGLYVLYTLCTMETSKLISNTYWYSKLVILSRKTVHE